MAPRIQAHTTQLSAIGGSIDELIEAQVDGAGMLEVKCLEAVCCTAQEQAEGDELRQLKTPVPVWVIRCQGCLICRSIQGVACTS